MTIWYIYKLRNIIDNKIYIGQTTNPKGRKSDHKTGRHSSKHLKNAIQKYGWTSFEFQIIASCLSQNAADETEVSLIEQHNSLNPDKGYNLTRGGKSGTIHTVETKHKISKASIGRHTSTEFKPGNDTGFKRGYVPWNKALTYSFKLNSEAIQSIKLDSRSIRTLAKIYGVSKSTIQHHKKH